MIYTPFNNRKVCSITENYELNELINRTNEESFFIRNENNHELHNKIDIINNYNGENFTFYYGRFGFEMETELRVIDIREEGIFELNEPQIITYDLPFWISDNGLILFKSLNNKYDKKGKSLLSERFFGDVNCIIENNFDIDGITNNVENRVFNNMWTSSFSGRHNNVQGGILNGNNVNDDVMFNQTQGTEKTSVGILYETYEEEIKLRFYRSGSFQLLTTELEMDNPIMFNILMEFENFII